MMNFILMCWEFFKTGLFAVGGGLATIPFLREMSVKYGWFTLEKLTTMIAVSESTPGPIGINMATYVGFETLGIFGGVFATLSLICPSIIVICIIARILEQFKEAEVVKGIFTGLRPAVVGFILAAVLNIYMLALLNVDVWQTSRNLMDLIDIKAIILFAGLMAFSRWKPKLHPIVLIVLAAIGGMILFGGILPF